VDGRTDIYAVGIILYEMLTGRQPYEADTPMAVAFKHITDPVPNILEANPALPNDVETVIQKAMAKNKDERFSTASDLVDTLRSVAAGQRISAELPTVKGAVPAGGKKQEKTVKVSKADAAPAARSFNIWLILGPVILVAVLGGGYLLFGNRNSPPEVTETAAVITETEVPALPTDTAEAQPTETSASVPVVVDTPTSTATPEPPTDTPAPQAPIIGGADKVALVANNEVWMMDLNGDNLVKLTNDGAVKTDLQWFGRNQIFFISGKAIKYYDISTDVVETLTTFPSEVSVDAFRISNDGKNVMLAMSNNIFVVPFDIETFKTINRRGQLGEIEGACIYEQVAKTYTVSRVRDVRWSIDDLLVAWLFVGNDPANPSLQSEQVSILDITDCVPETIDLKDNFPGSRFVPDGYENRAMPDFDWNGKDQFTFNTSIRNNGWGNLYIYNWVSHKGFRQTPISVCCFRDARWSPDGDYLFFAFQDIKLGAETRTELYYLPVAELNAGGIFAPIPMPDKFFGNLREAPQPALRPAAP
jgi:hypothetical protein